MAIFSSTWYRWKNCVFQYLHFHVEEFAGNGWGRKNCALFLGLHFISTGGQRLAVFVVPRAKPSSNCLSGLNKWPNNRLNRSNMANARRPRACVAGRKIRWRVWILVINQLRRRAPGAPGQPSQVFEVFEIVKPLSTCDIR